MVKCSFCEAEVRHLGEEEVEAGWGRATMRKGRWTKAITIVHCPNDMEPYVRLLMSLGNASTEAVSRACLREALGTEGEWQETAHGEK